MPTPSQRRRGARESKAPSTALKQRLELGASELRVSPFCVGMVGEPEVVAAAYRAGINFFFFSADMHWPAYEATREGLRQLLRASPEARSRLVVAVVSYVTQPEFCSGPFEEALGAVPGLDYVDVAVIGGAYAADYALRRERYRLVRPGRMRALGASFHDRTLAVDAVNEGQVDVAFVRYSSAHSGAEVDVFPLIRAACPTKLFSFKSMNGHVSPQRLAELGLPEHNWRPKHTDHYRFARRVPQLDGILCAFNGVEQIPALELALTQPRLGEAEADYLKQLSALDAGAIVLRST